jgi:hypothetical protein
MAAEQGAEQIPFKPPFFVLRSETWGLLDAAFTNEDAGALFPQPLGNMALRSQYSQDAHKGPCSSPPTPMRRDGPFHGQGRSERRGEHKDNEVYCGNL